MEPGVPGYRREFLRSPHHAVLALATVGVGFMTGQAIPLLVGLGLYALGWIHLPDTPLFRRWVDRRRAAAEEARARAELAAFAEKRAAMIDSLTDRRRALYGLLVDVCRDIERSGTPAGGAGEDPGAETRLRKIDELAWMYLRLLVFEQALEEFLETERSEDLPGAMKEAVAEAEALEREEAAARKKGQEPGESRARLLASARERATVLGKRIRRVEQARENLRLAASEQERLVQQVKLIRADVVSSRNAQGFSARIDATVEHLGETNRWLSEMEEYRDFMGDMPRVEARIGLGAAGGGGAAGRARERGAVDTVP